MKSAAKRHETKALSAAVPLLLLTLAITVVSCSKQGTDPVMPPLPAESINAEQVWNRITAETDYSEYHFWPGHEGLRPGQAPHGVFHKIFINKTLHDAMPVRDAEVPDGSIIVKENFSSDEEAVAITVMVKANGYDGEHNDWFWAKYRMDGTVDAEGQVNGCISCHEGMKNNDYIIVHPLDREVK